MFVIWLIVTAVLCYSVAAYMWSPPLQQLEKEFINTEKNYRESKAAIASIGILVNRWHYKIISHRGPVIAVIATIWLILTTLWIYY